MSPQSWCPADVVLQDSKDTTLDSQKACTSQACRLCKLYQENRRGSLKLHSISVRRVATCLPKALRSQVYRHHLVQVQPAIVKVRRSKMPQASLRASLGYQMALLDLVRWTMQGPVISMPPLWRLLPVLVSTHGLLLANALFRNRFLQKERQALLARHQL